MSELLDKQKKFTVLVAKLIIWADLEGYEMTFGEAYRTPAQAALNAKAGSGIRNSLHINRLAIDLNLFKSGKYQTDSTAYGKMGKYWKTLDPDCRWGGDFSKPDGNHFSITFNGVQ